jgi:hypothetical protein
VSAEAFLSGSTVVGLVLILAVLAIARANRVFLRDIGHDPEPVWRGLYRIAAAITLVMMSWIAIFDQWRQLLDEPLRRAGQFPSERIVFDPVAAPIRAISLVLLAASLLTTAPLIARHVGGYGVQLTGLISSVAMWLPLYTIRVRFDLGLAFGFGGDPSSPADVAGYLLYLLMTWSLLIAIILLAYAALAFTVALPVTLLLDITRRREPRITTEADPFFSSFSDRFRPPGKP